MGDEIYGINLDNIISTADVRDAIIRCFIEAHKEVLEDLKNYSDVSSDNELKNLKDLEVRLLIKKLFNDVGDDFNYPTKNGILDVLEKLKEFACNFRNQEIVDRHFKEIMRLVDKLE